MKGQSIFLLHILEDNTYDIISVGGPYFSDWIPDFTDWPGKYWTIYGMEKGTCHGIVNALDYTKDESNDLLDILFDHIVFIQSLQAKRKDRGEPEVKFVYSL